MAEHAAPTHRSAAKGTPAGVWDPCCPRCTAQWGLAGRPSPPHTHTLREAKRDTASFHPPATAAAHRLTRLARLRPGCLALPWLAARWGGGRAGRRWLWLSKWACVILAAMCYAKGYFIKIDAHPRRPSEETFTYSRDSVEPVVVDKYAPRTYSASSHPQPISQPTAEALSPRYEVLCMQGRAERHQHLQSGGEATQEIA
ncbi:hypothetical protein O3P69_004249 [Scylla paramamosain]|uniref:Uncharacterized protein n=1 Tax=Scylla paramamosain TaxID=85552 RepID=A0AAW0UIM6_SCYPA